MRGGTEGGVWPIQPRNENLVYMPKYHLLTFGCQMNKNDSERIVGLLQSIGFKESKPETADLLIVNTCSVRQSAEDRVYGIIKNWQKFRVKNPQLVVAVTGCMPGRDKDKKIRKKIKGVDLFFGIDELPMLPKWLGGLGLGSDDYLSIEPNREIKHKAFVTIQTGCNNFCTYCVVPYSRGRERNRPVKDIVKETKEALNNGAKEIMLLGQVVNNYQAPDPENFSSENPFVNGNCSKDSSGVSFGMTGDGDDFSALLWELNNLPLPPASSLPRRQAGRAEGEDNFRINFTAPDPQYFNKHQISALTLPKQANYLHLPVQSGNNEILRKMNRKYTREFYIDLVKKIKQARPDIALGTDIIVGFCGETEDQFAETVDLFKQCQFDISYHAKYSSRSGTVAHKNFKDDVGLKVKKVRWNVLQDLMESITFEKNQKYLGQVVEVLVDTCEQGICSGNSSEMKLTQFLGASDLVGQLVKVKINFTDTWLLRGEKI